MTDRQQDVFRVAEELYRQVPDWVTFFREVLGVKGIIRQAYPTPELLSQFEQTAEYTEIQNMLSRLRSIRTQEMTREPTRVITVRLPKSLHESLQAEAHDRHTSMNKLCIAKLLKVIEEGEGGFKRGDALRVASEEGGDGATVTMEEKQLGADL